MMKVKLLAIFLCAPKREGNVKAVGLFNFCTK